MMRGVLAVSIGLAAGLGVERAASACGACFHAPVVYEHGSMTQQVVTDHRMVMSVSPTHTTLWDQFRYAGAPDEFYWVLPMRQSDHVRVGVADNNFVDAVDRLTAPVVNAEVAACAETTVNTGGYTSGSVSIGCGANVGFFGYDAGIPMRRGSDDVVVSMTGAQVVGPYQVELVTASAQSDGLAGWLAEHHLDVPPSASAAVAYYTAQRYDFVVARLRPDAGVQQMQPIRVTVDGAAPTLPLRMISAGTGDKVGLTLMVLSTSRMEVRNVTNLTLVGRPITYDWTTGQSDYRGVFERALRDVPNAAWVTESAVNTTEDAMDRAYVIDDPMHADAGVAFDGAMVSTMDASPVPTTPFEHIDAAFAFAGLQGRAVVTRLRTELDHRYLDTDLELVAAVGGPLSNTYLATSVTNVPVCPSTLAREAVSQAPQPGCATAPRPVKRSGWLAGFATLGLASFVRARRRARRGVRP